ncbi:MAG TPA: hypothetical protein PLY93_03485 [Turneriella sp.]|nr:hypothetical protein [Turneriella sp.]
MLILPIVNDGDPANAYIGASLTEALRTRLLEIYFFIHPDNKAIIATQTDNLIQDEDFFTKTVALQMGVWLRQDLVLVGKYNVRDSRLKYRFVLYEIQHEKPILSLEGETPAHRKNVRCLL